MTGQLFEFDDSACPVMDCFEQLSTCQLVHSRIVSLYFVKNFLKALVTGHKAPAGAQLPCLSNEISKEKSLISCFESHEEALLDWVCQQSETSARMNLYASSCDSIFQRLFKASERMEPFMYQRRCLVAMKAIGDRRVCSVLAISSLILFT